MATIQDAIEGIQDLVGAVSGIREAPDYAPEGIRIFPFAVAYASAGSFEFGVAGEMKGLHDIAVEIHVARKNMRTALKTAMGFSDAVPAAIMADPTLGGDVDTFGSISYTFGAMNYGEMQTIGFRFIVTDVKIRTDL